ncbi:MAG: 4-hydroxy-tetrahydrodipicolinate synthase [Clostridia bacterium]|nr:4-hydroxy-tetrahydrodipicolinate synthase [Clostridia bacterium]
MSNAMFCGVGCALVTPFRNGRPDTDALKALIDFQLENDTDALAVCATTGEAPTLTDGEMCAITETAALRASGQVPVIAYAGSNSTKSAVLRAKRLASAGADALLMVTPYYNKPNQEGLIAHFTEIADQSPLPIILYNVPSRTGVELETDTALTLFKHPMIQGLKEATGNFDKIIDLIMHAGDGAYIYAGNDAMLLPMLALGARGVISVTANIAPREIRQMITCTFSGDYEAAREIHNRLLPLTRALFSDVNPAPVKAALSMLGLIQEELRLPLTTLSKDKKNALSSLMEAYGFIP